MRIGVKSKENVGLNPKVDTAFKRECNPLIFPSNISLNAAKVLIDKPSKGCFVLCIYWLFLK